MLMIWIMSTQTALSQKLRLSRLIKERVADSTLVQQELEYCNRSDSSKSELIETLFLSASLKEKEVGNLRNQLRNCEKQVVIDKPRMFTTSKKIKLASISFGVGVLATPWIKILVSSLLGL